MTAQLGPKTKVAVIGLGYVGLPLAVVLARHFDTIGFDINQTRVDELRKGHDRTDEVEAAVLRASSLHLTTNVEECRGADIFIVTVPTPVDETNTPDLRPVMSATRSVASVLTPGAGAIVVYESTVYPGVTEDMCGPELERVSGLKRGVDFFLGYSPERINPGDREHTVDRITKVISGENPEVLEKLATLYGSVTSGGVFRAKSIKAAEAAKVIENAQRDINIAFINEVAMIFQKIGLSAYDVLEAAGTKWNFLKFSPGLVGGHCIGVDPYYLSFRAQELGHDPEVILAGRRINDGMGRYIADCIHQRIGANSRVLVLGLTFKENVPDLRNSKVIDVIRGLEAHGHKVRVHDPLADGDEAHEEYGVTLLRRMADIRMDDPSRAAETEPFDAVVAAVPHNVYAQMSAEQVARLVKADGLVADIKGMWRHMELPNGIHRWQL
ncbi:nucleotide sugar dehydrogenase [Pedomonas mirosovicensis]|uniref:nucleotide sugar dehydrogenase n=1 Tax=Pedomonas mirosovicensis TaxID=2908641 RepID=UPI002167A601|nr:nucleotide sugar dehydrogenase [Pedomonas mirosovicensis]MCH8685614.1 nucleotide sugar dehydrogenase [Pedomonas mirosovicensis]